MSLSPEHLADLKNSGLSDETIAMMGVYSMPPLELKRFLESDTPAIESALAFPYYNAAKAPLIVDGKPFLRVKIFPPIKNQNGGTVKYLQKKNSGSHLYILPLVASELESHQTPLYIVEGEKKTAKAVELGLAAIGISGVWNWLKKNSSDAIDDFNQINFWRRQVFIVPDSDTFDQDEKATHLRRAVFALCKEIKARGASVKVVSLM